METRVCVCVYVCYAMYQLNCYFLYLTLPGSQHFGQPGSCPLLQLNPRGCQHQRRCSVATDDEMPCVSHLGVGLDWAVLNAYSEPPAPFQEQQEGHPASLWSTASDSGAASGTREKPPLCWSCGYHPKFFSFAQKVHQYVISHSRQISVSSEDKNINFFSADLLVIGF